MSALKTSADNLRQMRALADESGVTIVDADDLGRVLDALHRYQQLPLEDPTDLRAGEVRALATLNTVLKGIEPEASISMDYEDEWMRGLIWGYRTVKDLIHNGALVGHSR